MGTATLPEQLVSEQARGTHLRRVSGNVWVLAIAIATFVALSFGIAGTKAPWCDEGWFACPAYNLAFHGHMGTNVLEPTGHYLNGYLRGVQEHTYLNPPAHFVLLAGWFRVFGFSAVTMRAYSILWSSVTMAVLFFLVRRFAGRAAAALTAALTSIDFLFVWGSADGRMDAATGTLILSAIAAYMFLRERNLTWAIGASQALCAFGWLMHPIALLGSVTVLSLAWVYDRRRFRFSQLLIAAAPYAVAAAIWGIYIAQNPADFLAQFSANAAGRNAARFKGLLQPWQSIGELVVLYSAAYISGTLWTVTMNPWMFVVPLFYVAALIYAWRSESDSVRLLRICVTSYLLIVTFLVGFKSQSYMVILVPLHNALFALLLIAAWRGAADAKTAAAIMAAVFAAVQVTTYVQHVTANERQTTYRDAMRELGRQRSAGKTITAYTAAGFDLGFNGFVDDTRLGYYSRRSTDVLLLDRSYRRWVGLFEKEEPQVFTHAVKTLAQDYKLSKQFGDFWILERNPRRGDYDSRHHPGTTAELMDLVSSSAAGGRP